MDVILRRTLRKGPRRMPQRALAAPPASTGIVLRGPFGAPQDEGAPAASCPFVSLVVKDHLPQRTRIARMGYAARIAPATRNDPFLDHFRAAVREIYGDRLERIVPFGSRARRRGPDSDYDVAVFLRDMPDRMAELDRLADLRLTFFDETGAFIDAFPYPASAYLDGSPLMHEIRREGRDL